MNIVLTYFLNLLILSGLVYSIFLSFRQVVSRPIFFLALGLKVSSAILLGLVFQNYYLGGDTWVYFENAQAIAHLPWHSFWPQIFETVLPSEPVRAIYFTRITAVLLYLTKADYWLASVYFSLFSFFGTLYFLDQLTRWKQEWCHSALLAFLFFPTVIFWSSGLLKESLAFGSLLWLFGGYIKYENGDAVQWSSLWMIVPVLILILLKYYVLAVALPLVIYLIVFKETDKRGILKIGFWPKTVIIFVLMAVPTYFLLIGLHPYFEIEKFIRIVLQSHDEMISQSSQKNAVHVLNVFGGYWDFVINLLYYLFTGLFRPLPFDQSTGLGWFNVLENMIIMGFLIWKLAVIKWSAFKPNSLGLAMLSFIFIMAFFLTFTIPNLGALSRFKVYFMPFFLFMILIDHPVVDKIPKLKFIRGLW